MRMCHHNNLATRCKTCFKEALFVDKGEPKCVTHYDGCACVTAHRIELGQEVQRLQSRIAKLEGVIAPFARLPMLRDHGCVYGVNDIEITVEHFKAARKALDEGSR